MRYAIIEGNQVVNVVLAEPEYAAEHGWVPVVPEYGIGSEYVNGQFLPKPRDIDAEWADVRDQRDQLLAESDVYVLPDRWAVLTSDQQQAWANYRQALRDIPQNFSDPADVVWPTKP